MLPIRDLARCFIALLLSLVGSTIAVGQGSLGHGAAAPGATGQDALPRLSRWLQAGAGMPRVGPKTFEVAVGASSTGFVSLVPLPEGPTSLFTPGFGGTAVLVRIFVPTTGNFEVFLVYVPPTDPTAERPLLTGFHSYGASHGTIATFTTFLREAEIRRWFLVAPIQSGGPGFSQTSYGTPQSQEHVEAVLGLLLDYYAIDRDRIYAVGFSMGGGNAMSYAARHRDRRKGAFAAVMNHTGTVSLGDTYRFVPPAVRTVMETLFFGPPTQNPFDWTRASTIVLDGASQLVPGAHHMAINLTTTPVKTIYGLTDSNAYLIDQSVQLDQFFTSVGATNHILEPTVVPPDCSGDHCWDTADEEAVCNWLETITLDDNPSAGTILTDRSVRWGQFDIETDAANEFTCVDFALSNLANSIKFLHVQNLSEISFDLTRAGLNTNASITMQIESNEPGGDDYILGSFQSAPLLVERDSQQLFPNCTVTAGQPSWCFDAMTGELRIHEPGAPNTVEWRISP